MKSAPIFYQVWGNIVTDKRFCCLLQFQLDVGGVAFDLALNVSVHSWPADEGMGSWLAFADMWVLFMEFSEEQFSKGHWIDNAGNF